MPLIKQIFVVFFICLLGNFLSECIPLPIPNSIMAMVLMLVLLALRWLRADSIRQVVDFLQKNMVFFFIPSGVSLLEHYELLRDNLSAILVICVVSMLATYGAAAGVVWLVLRIMKKGGETQ